MLVSWNWLRDYVAPPEGPEQVGRRLMAAGLYLEGLESVGDDVVLDLEVTSNRPDCLGHLGVAREIATLYEIPLKVPTAEPKSSSESAASVVSVAIEDPRACPRYLARVIRGVKIGPSPQWLVDRLAAIGQRSVNNVVDVTNYALMDLAQPFHTFDLKTLRGGTIAVRHARAGETIAALNQKEGRQNYALDPSMLVIADGERPIALAGIMGGLETGVSESTTDLLLETANFTPLAIRGTARKLGLFSPSQYRFERGVDQENIEFASRWCAAMILEVAGGHLLEGFVDAFPGDPGPAEPVTLRFAQIERLLGIVIPAAEAVAILERLGLQTLERSQDAARFRPPTWRSDLTREADLIEEVGRIVGYDAIPDDAAVPISLSGKSGLDRVRQQVRQVLTARGFDEALTLSFVTPEELALFDPRPEVEALSVDHSSRRHENHLRKSLIPSLLRARRENERKGTFDAELFEIAKVYLKAAPGEAEAQVEPLQVSLVSGQSFRETKGVLEQIVHVLNPALELETRGSDLAALAEGRRAELWLCGERLGWIGELAEPVRSGRDLGLRDAVTIAEIDFAVLESHARQVARLEPVPAFPAVERDLNFVLAESVAWSELHETARAAAGVMLERSEFIDQFRGKQLGADKKSYVVRLVFRSHERTLTGDEVETAVARVVAACEKTLHATLRA